MGNARRILVIAMVTTAIGADRAAMLPTCRPHIVRTARRIVIQLTINLGHAVPAGRLACMTRSGPAVILAARPTRPATEAVHPADLPAFAYRLPPPAGF